MNRLSQTLRTTTIFIVRLGVALLICGLALQLYFLVRIGLMRWMDPQSTTFERSEMVRLAKEQHRIAWSQNWQPYSAISPTLKRAVIAAEDAGFTEHSGVEWDALEKAWERNQKAQARIEQQNAQAEKRYAKQVEKAQRAGRNVLPPAPVFKTAKVAGGSTITQQLAKNLFLSKERSLIRKGQEFLLTFMLEACLSKQRILELYLNHVEWGEGLFGAQAAAHHYFHLDASQLNASQSARLAVMLPAPKRFEKRPQSSYILGHAATIAGRLHAVELPENSLN